MSCKKEDNVSEKTKQFKLLMAKTGKTNVQIAEYLAVHERTIYRWLCGESIPPKSVMLALELMPT